MDTAATSWALSPIASLVAIIALGGFNKLKLPKYGGMLTITAALSGLLLFFPLAGIPWVTPLASAVAIILLF